MSKTPAGKPILTGQAMEALRKGDAEPLAQKIENGRGSISLYGMHPDDRARLARVVRTGDPLARGEKRQNNQSCLSRDIYMITRIFYWLGNGCPGFSNTATDTAFHRAVEDYENGIIPSAPPRTAESLYRHVWKPYLHRYRSGSQTVYDENSTQHQTLSQFLLGLRRSAPSHEDANERLSWFYREFMRDGEFFTLHKFQLEGLKAMLSLAGIQPEIWRKHLRVFGRDEDIDKILFG